ncbi:MAG: hypothetical protein WDW38_007671 [Sanguina aurantia]
MNQTAFAEEITPASSIPVVELGPGLSVSRVIKGCWQLSGGHKGDKETDRTGSQKDVVADCATFAAAGSPPCPRSIPNQAVDTSRGRLRVPSVALMQLYWNDYNVPRYVDAAKYLAEVQAAGKLQHIGVTNFDVQHLQQITDAGVRVVSNQVQYSLLDTRPENGMTQFCAATNMQLLPYGVLAGGLLSDKYIGMPIQNVVLDTYSKGKYSSVIQAQGGWNWFQSLLVVLKSVADKHGSTVSNVASRWVLQKPSVAAIVVGARNASHVQDHVALFGFQLDETDLGRIAEVLDSGKKPKGDCYSWERGAAW